VNWNPTLALILIASVASACATAAPTSGGGGTPTPGSPAASASNQSAQSSSGNAACGLVTKAEVEAAFGKPARDPEPKAPIGKNVTRCNYSDTSGTLLLTIEWRKIPEAAKNYDSLRLLASNGATDVGGVGDKSYTTATGLNYLEGTSLVALGASAGIGDPTFDARFVEMAKKAVARTN
jgi:hypothetical protein